MTFKVVMTARVLNRQDIQQYEGSLGVLFQSTPCVTEEEIITAASDADAVITLMQPYSRRVIEQLEKCRLIVNAGTGFDSVDLMAATEHGVCVAYPGDYSRIEVAEHVIALMLALARKINRLDRAVRAGKWGSFEKRGIRNEILPPTFRLEGKTLGLVGLGRIGSTVAQKVTGFGLNLIGYDPIQSPEVFRQLNVTPVAFATLLSESDFISIQASYSPDAKYMFGAPQFRMMKPTSYLINVARGTFINQTALVEALINGSIAGVGLDVVEEEPAGIGADHPLLRMENVIVTAHSAYYSEESSALYKLRIYEAVRNVVRGEWPEWLVNPAVKDIFSRKWQST